MNRSDSATTFRQHQGALSWRSLLATFLVLLTVGVSAGVAQTATLSHVPGVVCSGTAPTLTLAVAGIPAITTYNVANPAWPGLEAEEGGAGTANNINVVGNPFGADEVRLITGAEIAAEEAGGFNFVYYGSTHDLAAEGIYVSSNGFIRFSDGNPLNNNELTETGIVAQNIPAAAGPNHAIYFLNIDIDPQAGDDVDWDIQPVNGVGAVNNALVVTFRAVSQYNPNLVYPYNQVTVQVILYGSTHALTPNRIEVRLENFPDPGVIPARNHTIGIENLCGTAPAYPAIAPGAHNNATWANGQVPVGGPAVANGGVLNTAWTWDPVAGGPQAYSARLVNVGTNGIIDTYDINGAAQGDDSYVNAIVAGSPVLLPATAISATTRYAAIVQFGSNCEQIRSNVQVITVNPVPVAQTIGGPSNLCQGSTHNFTVAGTVPGSTFLWASTAPGAIVTPSGGQNLSASINFPGGGTLGGSNWNVSAQEIGPAPTNCSITSNKTITIFLTPSGVIAGPTPQCATGSSGPYTFSGAGAGITYNWTLSGAPAGSAVTAPNGSNTNITWGTLQQPSAPVVATLQLIATTGPAAICSSGPITYAITVNPMPVAKLPLTEGDATPCVNQQVTYSVVGGVVGNSYAWTLSAGGTFAGADAAYIPGTPTVNKISMVIAWATPGSKSITITETTGAGCSVAYTHNLTQTVQANPAPVVNGSNTPCQFIAPSGTNPTYQTTPNPLQFSYTVNVPNALNTYTWTVNNGGQIVATNLGAVAPTNTVTGVGITQVIVQWPNTGAATVVVTETTPTVPLNYGCTGTSTFNLNVQATPGAGAFTLTGNGIAPGTNPCANSTGNVYTVTLGADNHTFNIIGGTITASTGAFTASTTSFAGLGNFTVTWGAGTTGSISHEYANLAGCSAVETYTITIVPRPNGNISGPNAVCGGALNQNYTVVNNTIGGPIASHSWTITAGGGFVASSVGAGTPTFTVNYNNSGTGVVTIQDVITGPAPSNCTTTLTYNVNVTQTPAAPTYNAGTLTPCAGATVVYTLNGTAGLTTTVTSVTNGTIVGSNNFVGAVGNITITWGLVPTGGAGSFQYQTQNGACVSGVTTTNVTINALPTVPVITITPNITTFCVSSPFPFLDVTSTSGAGIVSFAWSGSGGLTGVQSDVPAGAPINDRFTINNFGGVGTKVITVTATDGNGCTRTNTITLTIEANPTPVISGPNTACQELTDPALTPAGPFTFANSNVYSTPLVAGHYYSWTSSNGYIVAYSTNGGGTWTPIAATTTTGVSAILGASQVRVAWYGSTPGKIKVSELNGPVSPPSCQTTTLDYNVALNVIPLAQTIGVTPQNICAGSTALLTQGGSQAGYTYRLEVSTDAGGTWSAPGAVATQAGTGAALAWNIPASVLAYTAVAPNVTDYRFRVTAQTNGTFGTPAVNCGWYVVTPNAQIFVNPQPAVVTPAIVTTLSCQGDLTGIQVNVPGSQTWVLYTLGRRQIRDFAGNPIVPGAFVSIPSSTLAGNGGTITLTDATFPAGGNPLLNADNYEYQVTGVTDMTLAPPPNIACTTVMPTTVTTRVFALPTAQVVSFTANPVCFNQDVLVTLTNSQDGVTYEIRRNGLSMAPVVEVQGAVGGGPVSVWIPKLSVLASNPAAPTVVNFDVRARLRTVGGGVYARPTPASNCPFVFGATAVTVNPKPVANITGATTVCGPSNQVYTAGPSAVPATTTYDWLITGAPSGTTPTVANNTGLGTINPLNVAWGVNNLSCNGVYNPVTATIRLIETNAFACADTTTRTITVNPTIADAAITSADGNSQACIYGGFESHLETYTLNRPVSCVFPTNTTFLWTMPTGAVSGVIRSGQNTNSIVAEWNTTGGTNIGVVTCVVTLPAGLGGCSTTYTFNETVYPLPQPVVNGPISVCQNQAGVIYTADVYPTDTYNWEVVGGLISGGAGLGTIASPATRSGLSLTSITVNWLDTPNNNAYVKLRQVSAAGCQNTTTRFVTVNPTPTPVVNGPDAVCDNRAYTYTTQNNAPSSSFLWTVIGNASITNGANTASATVQTTVAGSFTVTVTETILATNCSKSASKTVTIVTAPTPTITRTAPAGGTVGGACLNQTVTYTVSPVVAGRSYSWSAVNGTIVSGQGTSSINVNWTVVGNGSVTLNEWVTATQCTTTVNQNVTVAGPPTPSINGPNTVCGLSVVTYSTQFVAGNTYAWSLPTNGVITAGAATNACTVTWNNPLPNVVNPATLSVTETNTLSGCSATANLNVSVYYKPVSPAITRVTGSPLNQACNNSTIQYQIPNNAGSNYLWTVTGGTITAGGSSNIVTVQWTSVGNQTLTVTETNGLNASCTGLSTLNVSVTYQPTPSISGNATTCTTNTDTYTTGNVAGSTYAWTLPSGGGTILSGAASNTITVNWTGAGARTVQVVETNGNCSATATLNVTVGQTPTATAILRLIPAGPIGSACVGSTITYATTLTAGNNYAWTVTGGSFSGSNSGVNVNTANVVWNVVGTQTLTVVETTAGTNCSKTATQLVNVTYQPTPSISGAATTCTGNTETYSTGNVAGDTYAWTVSAGGTILTGAGSSSITVRWTANGPQTVSVLETATAGGCFASATLNVTVGQTPTLTAISRVSGSPLAQACAGSTVGYTTPGTAGNTYVWSVTGGTFTGASNGVNVNTVNVTWNVLGNQTLTVVETTAGTNCSRTATQNVSVTYQPSPSISGNATTCTNNVETYTTANVAGSAYVWTITPSANGTILSGAASNTISVRWNNAGSATVSVLETSNPGGCFATANLVVSVGQTPTTTAIARTTPVGDVGKACVGQTITYSTQNNVGNTYAWLATGGSITGASNTNTVSVLWNIIGTGTLRVTETTVGTNCSRTVVQNVDVTYTPTPVISGSTVACLNTIQTYSTPAVAGSTYFWSISAANSFAPVAGFPTSNSITVQWIQPGLQTITLTETASGGGCATTVTRQVQVNPIPTPSISSTTGYGSPVSQRPGLVCAGSTHVYTTFATPANVWNWVVTGGTIIGGQNTNTITVTWSTGAGGSVQVTETVPGSTCVTTVKDSIIIKPIPTPNITSATGGVPNVCANSVHTYTTPNVVGNSWVWTVTGGSIISGGGSNTITVQWGAAGPGTVAVTETVLGVTPVCATSTSRAITVNPNPNAPIITGPSPVCATNLNTTPQTINTATYSSNITSTPAAISTYTWSVSSNGQIVTNATTSIGVQWFNTTTVPQNGTVTLTHTNIFGCSTTSSISVTINPNPTPSISGPNSVCQNTIQSYGTPGVPGNTYAWTITGGIIRGGQGTPNVQVEWTLPGGGTLTVSERNTFNCTVLNTLNVTINQLPTARVTASGPTTFCQGGDVTLSAPLGFASYAWNTGETGRNIVANRTGLYWVVVTDNNGCSNSSDSIQVNVFPTTLPIITASGPRTFCEGGSVTLTAPAGFSIYRWSNGATTRSITVTTSGEYTVAIADTNGCTGTSTPVEVIVYAKPQPVLTTIGSTTVCSGDSVIVTAPAGYNSYTWSSSAGTNYGTARTIVVKQTDDITVSVVDINGCVGTSDTVKITLKPAISPVVTANGPLTFCEGNAVTLSAPTGFNSYYWSNGATTREITVTDGGKYTVTVTDNTRCEATSPDLNVKVNLLPARPTINRTGDTLKAISSVADAYQWYRNGTMITGATNQKLIVALPGTYRVEIMDDNTCSSMSQPFDVILTDVNDDVVAGHTNGLEIFPNPTNGMFTVSATTSEAGSVRIELFNLVGEKVLSVNDMAQGGQFKSTVDMGQLASGVYNVVVTTNNERWTVRLVRQ